MPHHRIAMHAPPLSLSLLLKSMKWRKKSLVLISTPPCVCSCVRRLPLAAPPRVCPASSASASDRDPSLLRSILRHHHAPIRNPFRCRRLPNPYAPLCHPVPSTHDGDAPSASGRRLVVSLGGSCKTDRPPPAPLAAVETRSQNLILSPTFGSSCSTVAVES
jgi:hypothetical protein